MTFAHARLSVRIPALRLFAGLLPVLCLAAAGRASPVVLEPVLESAPFAASATSGERTPVRAFATAAGVYELDAKQKAVRVWPRDEESGQLVPAFFGTDAAGAGANFSQPVSMAKKPGANLIAVVDSGSRVGMLEKIPRIAFYEFSETVSGGVLSSVSFTFRGEITNAILANATDVAFFPSGDRVAVSICRFSSSATAGDEGAVQIYDVPASASAPVAAPADSFLLVRTKNVYAGSATAVGAEPYNIPASSVAVATDGAGVWVGSAPLSAVLRYDPDGSGAYDEPVTIRTFEFNMDAGPQYVDSDPFPGAVADFVQGPAGLADPVGSEPASGFDPGDLGTAGSTNNLLSVPAALFPWASPNGNLLVVADRDNDRVIAFDEAGNERFVLQPSGRVADAFARPEGVWISDDGAEIVVADTGNGRVRIFALTDAVSAPDETVTVEGVSAFLWESDAEPSTNWIVAASASLTNRTYAVSVASDPAGCVRVEPAEVTIPAGAIRAPFVLWPDDGAADGTAVTLSVAGEDFSLTVSNAVPTVRTGPLTGSDIDNESYLYMEEGPANAALSSFRYGVLREGEGIHLHAKAFDVAADGLTYEWRVVGTTNTLQNLSGTTITNAVGDPEPEPNPVFVTEPCYTCEYADPDRPWIVKSFVFTAEQVADFPTDAAGNPVYRMVSAGYQGESITNDLPLTYGENVTVLDDRHGGFAAWAPVLFDDEAGAPFRVSDETLTGADVVIPSAADGTLYFVALTVTDKDGAVWNSLDSANRVFFCFATAAPEPPADPAVYAAVFTSVSSTNVAFVVTVASGTPAAGDTVTLESTVDLATDVWTPMETLPVDGLLTETELFFERFPDDSDPARFYRVVQP